MGNLIKGIKGKREGENRSLIFETLNHSEGKIVFDGSYLTSNVPVHVPDGTAAVPGLRGATINSGIYFSASCVNFSTAGSERVVIDGQGDLNVGTYISIGNGGTGQIIGDKKPITEAVTTILTAAHSGSVFFVNSDTATATFTLPDPVAGLYFKWLWVANCDNAIIIKTADLTDTTGDMFRGCLLISSAAAVNSILEATGDVNTLTFDDNDADNAAGAGTWVEIVCTEDKIWMVTGIVNSTTDADSTGAHFSDTD